MEDKRTHIHIEKIKLLYLHSLIPILLSGVAGLFLVAALWSSANHRSLLIWLGVTIFLAILRTALISKFQITKPEGLDVLKWEMPYAVSLLAVFFSWSFGLLWIMPRDNLSAVFILNTFSIGLAGAAISWYSPLRYLQMATISLALLPMIGALLTLDSPEARWVGIAACCMYISCMITSILLQKTFNGNLELAYDLALAKKEAESLASTDMLTGLNNRRAFFDKADALFSHCRRSEEPISVLMLDIDHFKKINDNYGHAVGDLALQNVGKLIQKNLRQSDLCCRFGGEEFVLLLPDTSRQAAVEIATQLQQLMRESPLGLFGSDAVSLTASFGVCDIGNTLDELLNNADLAMYHAKHQGRNCIITYMEHMQNSLLKPIGIAR